MIGRGAGRNGGGDRGEGSRMRRFEFSEGSSSKFWEIGQDGCDLNIRWGRIGTQGQQQTKTHADEASAAAAMAKLIGAKLGKGYTEAGAGSAGAAARRDIQAAGKTAPSRRVATAAQAGGAATTAAAVASPPSAPAALESAPQACVDADIAPGIPPWLAHGEPFAIPDAMLAAALPSRRFPAPVVPVEDPVAVIQATAQRVLRHARQGEPGDDPELARALEEGWQRLHDPVPKASPQVDAAMLALMLAAADHYYRSEIDMGLLVDALVARDGLPAALEALLHAQRSFEVSREWGQSTTRLGLGFATTIEGPLVTRSDCPASAGEWAFRRHLAAADEAVYARCVGQVREALPQLHPARQAVMALLLPDEPDLSNQVALAHAGPNAPAALHWLLLTATDPAALAAIGKVKLD